VTSFPSTVKVISGAALRGVELENSRSPATKCYSNQLRSLPDLFSPGSVPFDRDGDDEQTPFEAPAMALRLVTVVVAPEITRSILDKSIVQV
jgi:hypothetical protein